MSPCKTALLVLVLIANVFSARGVARAQEAPPGNAKTQNLGPLAYRIDARLLPAINAVRSAAATDAKAALDVKAAHGRALARTAQAEHLAIHIDAPVNDALLAQIRATGAVVTHTAPQWNTVSATATVSQIDSLSQLGAVRRIMLQAGRRLRQQGSTANQADSLMNADKVRTTFGVTGAGQKVGVISDSVTDTSAVRGSSYAVSGSAPNATVTGTVPQQTGDLPASFQVVDFGPGGGTDEGEPMMELIYDVAPGAALAFASAGTDQTTMASNLLALRTAANCTVIADDIGFIDEPFFQDGPIAQAITTNFNAGVLHFSAIGNDGTNGIITTYNPINSTVDDLQDPPSGNCFHNWGINTSTPSFLPIFLPAGDELIVTLEWNQPFQSYGLGSGSQADLDIYLYSTNAIGQPLAWSVQSQGTTGSPSGDPVETIDYVNRRQDRTVYLVVNHYQGVRNNVMRLILSDYAGTFSFPAGGVNAISAYGHPATQDCIGVGAMNWSDIQNGVLRPESFSSEGGMGAAGVPYYFDTSGNALAGAPVTVSMPVIAAPDGCDTSLQTDFLGTSCAAPNAAAVAALLLQRAPSTSPATLTAVLKSSARDATAAPASVGPDAFTGWGLIDAYAAFQALAPAAPTITSPTTASGTVGQAFTYQITASNGPTSYNATNLPSWASVNTSTGVISGTPKTTGSTSVTISATNVTGTGTANLTITVSLPQPPVISSPSTASGIVGQPFTYQITASNNPTSYGATNLPSWASVNTSTGAITGTPDTPGSTSVTISATNVAGTGTAKLTITISLPQPPVISSPSNAAGIVGQAFSYTITASNSPISFNATGLPPSLSVNTSTGVIAGTPNLAGQTVVTLGAMNAGGTGTATLTITVALPAPPVINSTAWATCTMGQAFSYQITATNYPTSYNATGLPSGLSISGNSITGIPTVSGQVAIGLSATNAGGTGSATLVLTIFDSSGGNATIPDITSFPATPDAIIAGQSVTLTAAASDASGDLLLYSWDFGDGTSAYGASVTHVYSAAGIYNATLTVSNGVNAVMQTVYVAVNAAAPDTSGGSGPLPNVFAVLRAAMKFNFKSYGKDSITLSGTIPLQKNFNPLGTTAVIAMGDLEQTFTLNARGKGGDSSASLALAGKLKKGIFAATPAKFTLVLRNQPLWGELSGLGFTNSNVPKAGEQIEVPVLASIDGVSFVAHLSVVYTAKAGVSGSAKN